MIRQFETRDAERCSEIVAACVERDPLLAPESLQRILETVSAEAVLERSRLHYLAVCETEGTITGFGGLDMNEVRLLYVAPESHGRGIGTALLEHLEAMVPGELFSDIFVYAALSAIDFYRRNGYRAEGEWRNDLGGAEITTMFMRKELRRRS